MCSLLDNFDITLEFSTLYINYRNHEGKPDIFCFTRVVSLDAELCLQKGPLAGFRSPLMAFNPYIYRTVVGNPEGQELV